MIIDFHNHYYPETYLSELAQGRSRVNLQRDAAGRTLLHYPGDYNVIAPGHRDLDERLRVMDQAGIDTQAISLTTPGVHIEEPQRGVQLARLVNDAFAEAAAAHPGRFVPLAALPLQDPPAAVTEAERAVTQLDHRGVLLFSHINERTLDDHAYLPLFETLAGLRVPIFLHPTSPRSLEAIQQYRLAAILGFLFDTTVAVARLVFSGVFERFPDLTIVLGHLGGTVPYLVERMDRGYAAYTECREHITQPPSAYVRKMYLDTVNFNPHALKMAAEFMGTNRLVLGTDYPHEVGDVSRAVQAIGALQLTAEEKANILGHTAAHLLNLPDSD